MNMGVECEDQHTKAKLYEYLKKPSARKAMGISPDSDIHLKKMSRTNEVFLVTDRKSHKQFVLKSFCIKGISHSKLEKRLDKEFRRLQYVRQIGVGGDRYRVVRTLGRSDDGLFLIEEYIEGNTLSYYMKRSLLHHDHDMLYKKLTLLAGFLSRLHRMTALSQRVDAENIKKELRKHVREARRTGALDSEQTRRAENLIGGWCSSSVITGAYRSLVHGDVTPANLIYRNDHLYVIDMERSGYNDPAYDLGMIAGELFHYAMLYTSNPYHVDGFIGHLYWMYAGNFSDQYGKFLSMTKRNPLYMANSLLRIARNEYLTIDYKKRLGYYAIECLKSLDRFKA